jgi:hypothetical protein
MAPQRRAAYGLVRPLAHANGAIAPSFADYEIICDFRARRLPMQRSPGLQVASGGRAQYVCAALGIVRAATTQKAYSHIFDCTDVRASKR